MVTQKIVRTRRMPWVVHALLFAAGVLLFLYWRLPLGVALSWSVGLGLLLAAGGGAARHGRRQLADAALVARARSGESAQPRDGERIAVFGTLETAGTLLHSQLRRTPCLAYQYQAYHHERRRRTTTTSEVIDYSGIGAVPLLVRGVTSAIGIGGYPWFADFAPFSELASKEELAKGRRALGGLRFEDVSMSEIGRVDLRQNSWTGRSTLVKHYRRLRGRFNLAGPAPPVNEVQLRERVVLPGVPVCAIGVWSSARRQLIGTGDGIERELWIWSGEPHVIHERILGSGRNTRGCGWFLIAVAAATVTFLLARSI